MTAILYPLKMDKDLTKAYSLIYEAKKDTKAMKDFLDDKAKEKEKKLKNQKPEYRNNPAFGDESHHSNAKNK